MYIQPNSIIELFEGVRLDTSCQETIYFESRDDQNTYFTNHTWAHSRVISLTNYSYIGDSSNTIKVDRKYADTYKVNYMRFKNIDHGDKWFYAFVTKVQYVNENCCRIYWVLDRMQTWLVNVDYDLSTCMVEREHSATDEFGENLVDEDLGLSDYKYGHSVYDESTYKVNPTDSTNYYLAINVSKLYYGDYPVTEFPLTLINASLYDRTVCSGGIILVNIDTEYDKAEEIFKLYNDTPEQILQVYMIPKTSVATGDYDIVTISNKANDTTKTVSGVRLLKSGANGRNVEWPTGINHDGSGTNPTIVGTPNIDGYTPKNNKLYTFPYNFLTVYTNNAENQVYRFEFMPNENDFGAKFIVQDKVLAPYTITCRTGDYKGWVNNVPFIGNGLSISNTPICNWNNDAYKAWLNTQGKYTTAGALVSNLSIGGGGIAKASDGLSYSATDVYSSSNIQGVVNEATITKTAGLSVTPQAAFALALTGAYVLNNAMSTLKAFNIAKTHDVGTNGNLSSESTDYAHNILGFYAVRTFITREWAEKLDKFFTAYGYATKTIKKPNVCVRAYWTYTKTSGSSVKSINVSAEDIKIINDIFNNGVRFYNGFMPTTDFDLYDNVPL